MSFAIKLLYYCLLAGTGCLSLFYIKVGLFNTHGGDNPYHMKEWLAFASIFVILILYRAYKVGEVAEKYNQGLWLILASWLCWGVVLLGFLILAKMQGKI